MDLIDLPEDTKLNFNNFVIGRPLLHLSYFLQIIKIEIERQMSLQSGDSDRLTDKVVEHDTPVSSPTGTATKPVIPISDKAASVTEQDQLTDNLLDSYTNISYENNNKNVGESTVPSEPYSSSESLLLSAVRAGASSESFQSGGTHSARPGAISVSSPSSGTHSAHPGTGSVSVSSASVKKTLVRTGRKTGRKFSCRICGRKFNKSIKLKIHQQTHLVLASKAENYSCEMCPQKFTRKDNMSKHIKNFHASGKSCNVNKNSDDSNEKNSDDHDNGDDNKNKCNICEKTFKEKRYLTAHTKTHNPEFLCAKCGKGFVRNPRKNEHEMKCNLVQKIDAKNAIEPTRKPPSVMGGGGVRPLDYNKVFQQSSPSNCIVYVEGVTTGDENALRKAFTSFGRIIEIRYFKDKGYAFVRYDNKESACNAIVALHCTECEGQIIKCSWGKEEVGTGPEVLDDDHLEGAYSNYDNDKGCSSKLKHPSARDEYGGGEYGMWVGSEAPGQGGLRHGGGHHQGGLPGGGDNHQKQYYHQYYAQYGYGYPTSQGGYQETEYNPQYMQQYYTDYQYPNNQASGGYNHGEGGYQKA